MQKYVKEGSLNIKTHSPSMHLLASASATSNHLTTLLQKVKQEQKTSAPQTHTSFLKIDKTLFSTEEVSKMSHTYIVAKLYHQGLPYLSSTDRRRFATQIELSHHLDYLFQKNQSDKTIERKEERWWCAASSDWMLETK